MFTKGPWKIIGEDVDDYNNPVIEVAAGEMGTETYESIAHVSSTFMITQFVLRDENWANAHLIAAAPDLYEALKELLNDVVTAGIYDLDEQGLIMAAREALDKAEGKS